MNANKSMVYLLSIRCVIFVLIFVIGAIVTKQKVEDIINWWSIVASILNIVAILVMYFLQRKILHFGISKSSSSKIKSPAVKH